MTTSVLNIYTISWQQTNDAWKEQKANAKETKVPVKIHLKVDK